MQQVDRFRIEEELGRGQMGAVYRAHDPQLNRSVALKVILSRGQLSPESVQRFHREMKATGRLQHPNIVGVQTTGTHRGQPYMVMHLVEGISLEGRLLRDGPLAPREAARLAEQLARALHHAHERGVLHRDVKPANVMLDREQNALLTDFGLAKLHGEDVEARLTLSADLVGSPIYMAPEQATAQHRRVGPASDVYGLGATLYEMLTGKPPFWGDSLPEVLWKVSNSLPPPPSRAVRTVDARIEAICLKCLAKLPEERYASAELLAADLRQYLEEEPKAPAAAARSRPALLLVAVALLVLFAVIGAFAIWLGRAPAAAPVAKSSAKPPEPPAPTAPAPPPPTVRTLVLQPGPLLGKDTYVRCDSVYLNDNFGISRILSVGDRARPPGDFRAFLRFDLSNLPRQAKLRRATLALWLSETAFADRTMRVRVQRVRPSKREGWALTPWREGTGTFDRLIDGMVWDGDFRRHRLPPDKVSWAQSGRPELTQPGVDPEVVADLTISAGTRGWIELDLTKAVRAWRSGAPNHGVRLAHVREGPPHDDGLKYFLSSDATEASRRPRLTIEFTGPAAHALPDEGALERKAVAAVEPLLREARRDLSTKRAWELANQAVRQAPFYGEAYWVRAQVAVARNLHFMRALFDMRVCALLTQPFESFELLRLRGQLELRDRKPHRALLDLRAALKRRPKDVPTLLAYGRALLRAGRNRDARATFRTCLQLEPGSVAAQRGLEEAEAALGD